MATEIQQNLEKKNAEYASNFKEGHLALPPAKKYAVGRSLQVIKSGQGLNLVSNLHGRTHRSSSSLRYLPRRRPCHPQRRRQRTRRHPLPSHLRAAARHERDPPHKAYRLWHAHVQERRRTCGCGEESRRWWEAGVGWLGLSTVSGSSQGSGG